MARKAQEQEYDAMQVRELLLQALETERGGIKIYENAIQCAVNPDLKKEWTEYLQETRRHEEVLTRVFELLEIDTEMASPGRQVVDHLGESLVMAMQMARESADAAAAELVAGECVVLAETKDHLNWELIGHIANNSSTDAAKVLKSAHEAVEKDEDHHLYHTTGWTRELWIQSLGFPAMLPPPEEVKNVESKMEAARAEQARNRMM
jgi:hypothetical protein